MPAINLKDIAHDVARDNPTYGDKGQLENVLAAAMDVILERVANGDTVRIHKFGSFRAKLFKGRTLNSPIMQGGKVAFKDQLVLRFHQAPVAKRRINEQRAPAKQAKAKAAPAAEQPKKAKKALKSPVKAVNAKAKLAAKKAGKKKAKKA